MGNLRNNILFVLMGAVVFSPLGSYIVMSILNLPLSLPELLIIPFIFLLKPKFKSLRFSSNVVIRSLLFVVLMVMLGIVWNVFPIGSLLKHARPIFYAVLFTLVFKRENLIDNNDLLYLAFGCLVGWMIDARINIGLLILTGDEDLMSTFGVLLSIPAFLSLSMKKGRYYFLLIGIAVIFVTIVLSSTRRIIVITLLALFIALILVIIRDKKKITRYSVISVIVVGALSVAIPFARSYIEGISPVLYHRTFTRVDNMIENQGDTGTDSDKIRSNDIKILFSNLEEYTIPHGMIGKSVSQNVFDHFADLPILVPIWMFGWPLAFVLLWYFLKILYKNLKKYLAYGDETSMFCCCVLTCAFALLFIEGTYLLFPYAAPITGLVLGRSILNAKNKRILYS